MSTTPSARLLVPVERMRRWLTPADINGTGKVDHLESRVSTGSQQWRYDALGRVEFNSYFRPPGSPGVINTSANIDLRRDPAPTTAACPVRSPTGPIQPPDPFYTERSRHKPSRRSAPAAHPGYLPDMTNNPMHGFESFRFPNQTTRQRRHPPASAAPAPIGGPVRSSDTQLPPPMEVDPNSIPIDIPNLRLHGQCAFIPTASTRPTR